MTHDEVLNVVEAIASGELTPDALLAAHLASCPTCVAALEGATDVERMLRSRPVPAPPAQFTARTLARVRRAWWRSEQFLDAGFNLALIGIVISICGGLWLLLHWSGLVAVSNDALALFGTAAMGLVRRVAPSLPLYAGATALLASALGLWWWAERDVTF